MFAWLWLQDQAWILSVPFQPESLPFGTFQWRMEETGTGDVAGLGVDFENPYAHCRKCVSTDKIERLRNDADR
jgi:hypothetical protein